ncbi:MAG TPA: rod shape-determining protein RodA [Dehalococcoidia bacterium]|nr:rod shape-determining protein RodA [Dehalococcoidia bacterium]
MIQLRPRYFDIWMLVTTLALVGYGALLIYSASLNSHPAGVNSLSHPVAKQVAYIVLGLLVMIFVANIDYRLFGQIAPGLYAIGILMLASVLVIGNTEFGSRRWINFAGTQIQPSEIAKLITILALARFMADRPLTMSRVSSFLATLGIVALPIMLVLAEPDMGTAVIFGVAWIGMLLLSGARLEHILIFLSFTVLMVPFVTLAVMDAYQRDRIAVFFNPNSDPLGSGYNILQAEISIGSGGPFGKGLFGGTQTQLDFLHTPTTDYIFSVLGEELGLMGALVLLALFTVLLFRGLRVAALARDRFGQLLATGIVIMILFQVFINIAVNIRLLPVTGIPLPFISQGGSSLITLFVALGLLQSIVIRHKRIDFGSGP